MIGEEGAPEALGYSGLYPMSAGNTPLSGGILHFIGFKRSEGRRRPSLRESDQESWVARRRCSVELEGTR